MAAEPVKSDLCVVGGGIAGFAAAVALKQKGKHVVVVAKSGGATSVSSGAWDLGPVPTDPADFRSLRLSAEGERVYRSVLVDADGFGAPVDVAQGLGALAEALAPELAMTLSFETPLCLPSASGRWKRTYGAQAVQAGADLSRLARKKIGLVASRQWRFPSEALAARWMAESPQPLEITPVWVELRGADWPLTQIATRLVHDPRFRDLFTQFVTTALGGNSYDALLFPPLFLDPAFAIQLGERLGIPVAECLSTTEPVAGKRLKDAMEKALARLEIPLLPAPGGSLVPTLFHRRVTALKSAAHDIRARHYILATGKIFGGGIRAEGSRFEEPIFSTPLFHSREERATDDSTTVGIWVDGSFRPRDELGEPWLDNLSATGSVLGGVDFSAARLGAGFHGYAGFRCGRSLE